MCLELELLGFRICIDFHLSWILPNSPFKCLCRITFTPALFWVLLQNWGPTQVEYDNFKLRTRFLKHHSVVSPPSNQKKTTHIAALILKVAFSFWSLMMIILLGLLFGPCLIYDKVQQFQAKLLLLGGCMLVSGWIPWLRSDRERLLLC